MAYRLDSVHYAAGGLRLEPGDRRVTVRIGELVLADSLRVVVVHERLHPLRYYLAPEDVRTELLTPSPLHSYCPYKGDARHWALAARGGAGSADSTGGAGSGDRDGGGAWAGGTIAWSYPQPLPGMEPLAGLLAFYQERVDLTLGP